MRKRNDGFYKAEKGKHFVLTEKGKEMVPGWSRKIVGQPVDEYDYEAVTWAVESNYVEEVDIPGWTVTIGFSVVYDYKGHTLYAGNPVVFPKRELAEKYMRNYAKNAWLEHELYIKEETYEGPELKECTMFDGKPVYNKSWYYGPSALEVGDLVDGEIVDNIINCLPPACMRSDCTQLGEPTSHRIDENGNYRPTYETFKKVSDNVWVYCGDCFQGSNVMVAA